VGLSIETFNFGLPDNKCRKCVIHFRYVFGNEPYQDWGPDSTDALTMVRAWRLKLSDGSKVVDGLMKAYKQAAVNKELHSYEVAMVAFAVFSFLL